MSRRGSMPSESPSGSCLRRSRLASSSSELWLRPWLLIMLCFELRNNHIKQGCIFWRASISTSQRYGRRLSDYYCRLGAVLFLSMKERKIFLGKDIESEMIMRIFDFCLKFCHIAQFSPHPLPQPIYSPNRTDRGLFQSSHLFETRCF